MAELLAIVVLQLLLTALPGVAGALLAARLGVRNEPLLLATALASTGVVAMLDFWAYYGDHEVGQTFSFLAIFASVLICAWTLWEREIPRELLRRLATPLALWALGSAFLVFLGFVHGGTADPLGASSTRFSGLLPADNFLPLSFSDWFFAHGHDGAPPHAAGDWLASDRPPLQIGFTLLQRTFVWDDHALHYQVLGVVLQQLWIVGLWALLVAGRAGRVTRGVAMATVLVSDIAIVNGFFVWPKLLPAAMLLAAAALVLTPLWEQVRRSLWGAALLATLLGLAMMGHGASVFGILPLLAIAAWRGLPNWRWIGIAALAVALVMAPWSAYQRYGEPPGNRLTKWFLGGVVEVDDRGVGEAIVDGYREAGFGGTLHKKGQNFVAIFGGKAMADNIELSIEAAEAGDFENIVRPTRATFFFDLVPSLGLLLVAIGAMAVGYRRRGRDPTEWRLALACLAAFGLGAVIWALLQFGGATAQTVIHQGSYLLPLLGICGAAVGVRAVYPRFALWLLGVNFVLMLVIYVPAFEPPPDSSYLPARALAAGACLAAFLMVGLHRRPDEQDAEQASA